MKCDECNNANICLDHIELPSLGGCTSGIPERKITTNADRIRSMSDAELAEYEWLTNMTDDFGEDEELYKSIYNLDTKKVEDIHDSYGDLLDWLQSPVDDKVSDLENFEVRR